MNISSVPRFPLRRLAVVVATMGAGQVILLTLVPLLSELCGLSIASIGGIVALGTFCFMLAGPLWGAASDRMGRRLVILTGLVGALVAQGLFVLILILLASGDMAMVAGLWWLSLSRVLYGLSASSIYPACQAWAVENAAVERRLATLSGLSAAANLGRVLGPLLALPALLLAGMGLQALWPLAWLLLLPALGLGLVLSIHASHAAIPVAQADTSSPGLSLPLCALFTVALLGTTAIGQMQMLLGPVLTDYYRLSAVDASTWAACLLLAVAAVSVAVQIGFVRRLQAPRLSLGLGAALLLGGVVVLWGSLGQGLALAGLLLFVTGVACLVPGYTTLAGELGGDARRGRLFGLLSLMHTAGYTLGFALGGWNYTHLPAMPLLGLLVAVCLLGAAAVPALLPSAHRKTGVVKAVETG